MEERIKAFMKAKNINAAELADTIGVQRSNVSHVLNGRNKPSFFFIEKLLQAYPDINARWLLLGVEDMLSSVQNRSITANKNLFSQHEKSEKTVDANVKESNKISVENNLFHSKDETEKKVDNSNLQTISELKNEVESVIIFYTDKTFVSYKPQ